ncbi:hypothetical protein GIB67_028998 [Kingdonia uniflora]|uniref:Uncharacterized protein n=1 Tax=Kingdonia uniflora TaxID=39325 RepID=A0A7J7N679_9MAGN|nr:hypothetical protein GIB67_028998 [Kingdonia uniflora]
MYLSPEFQAPPEIYYNDTEARKYISSSHMVQTQWKLSEKALELLGLPHHGLPRLHLDIGLSEETLSLNGQQWIGLDILSSMLSIFLFWRKLSERVLKLLGLPHHELPHLLLDIGCGSRLSGETLSENGQQWISFDISNIMLNIFVFWLWIRA